MSFTKSFNKGRGVLAAASRLNASMENIAPAKEEKLNLSQEGIAGWLGGFLVSASATLTTTIPFLNTGIAAGTSAAIVNLRKNINHIGKEIAKVRQQATEEAYKDGKIPEVVYKAEKAINVGDVGTVLLGALFGTIPVVNWFYNAGAVSKLQDLSKELEEKTKELKDLVAANSKPGVSQEDLDEKLLWTKVTKKTPKVLKLLMSQVAKKSNPKLQLLLPLKPLLLKCKNLKSLLLQSNLKKWKKQ
jgi:hypothetical protein